MHVPQSAQSVCWFVFDPKWAAVNDLNSVWSSPSLCGTPVGRPNPLREAMTSQWSNLRALIIDAFVNKFNCSKHDVTMASGSQATVRTCNDYSGRKVRSFSSRCGRHDTLSLLTVILRKFLLSALLSQQWARPFVRACQILIEQSKENAEIGRKICRTGSIYLYTDIMAITNRKEWLHFNFHNDIEYTNFEFLSI